jgi:hypothetical protein
MRKFVCAAVVVVFAFSVAVADEFIASVRKIDGDKVTFVKKAKKGEEGKEMTLPLAKDAKILKGKYSFKDKAFTPGDPVERAALTTMLEKAGEKGVTAQLVTDADNKKITEVRLIGGKKKKKVD